jgi:hypothetical protein
VNITLGGAYSFIHCTFANFWSKGKVRDKATVRVNNYNTLQVIPLSFYLGNCIVDGKLRNELQIDLKDEPAFPFTYTISNCWLRTEINTTAPLIFVNNKIAASTDEIKYKELETYDFEPELDEVKIKNFTHPFAERDAKLLPRDINNLLRKTDNVTAGAYEIP